MKSINSLLIQLLIISVTIFFSSCSDDDNSSNPGENNPDPVRVLSNYNFNPQSSLEDRVTDCPDFVLDYLKDFDSAPGYTSYTPTEDEMQIIEQTLDMLPEYMKNALKERLVGIYFINDLQSSGFTDYIFSSDDEVYSFIALNYSVFNKNLPELLAYKENTCFIPADNMRIEYEMDTELPGFLYIFMHEAGHALDYSFRYTPWVEPAIFDKFGENPGNCAFTYSVWADYDELLLDYEYPNKDLVTFYGFGNGPKIKIEDAEKYYKELESSPLLSLYSIYNWAEDFAEFQTLAYIANQLGSDYKINIIRNDSIIYSCQPMKRFGIDARIQLLDPDIRSYCGK